MEILVKVFRIVVALSVLMPPSVNAAIVGDINNDGQIDLTEAILLCE